MLIVGIEGVELAAHERERLLAPSVSGTILFTRNFADRHQLQRLIGSIRDLRGAGFLVCVDQEGGPVQRFRAGFTRLPRLASIGDLYRRDRNAAISMAEMHALVMASELRACDVDLSFAPVVDLGRGNRAIGERAFSADPGTVGELAAAYVRGMRLAGMAATLKHFPGHGSVREDTHREAAVDPRALDEIRASDLLPFADGIAAGAEAVMMAHVAYPAVDPQPAGRSRRWIADILRGAMDFRGVVVSDDLGMSAAESTGGVGERVGAYLEAGCDLALVCAPATVGEAIRAASGRAPCDPAKFDGLLGNAARGWDALLDDPQHARYVAALGSLRAREVSGA